MQNEAHTVTLESLHCGNCGAALTTPLNVSYVTCRHCGAALAVKRTDSVVYTEKISQTLDRVNEHLVDLATEKELERIDQEWAQEREKYVPTRGIGNQGLVAHTQAKVMAFGVVSVIVGIVINCMAFNNDGLYSFIHFVGLAMICFGGVLAAVSYGEIADYQSAYRTYQDRRKAAERKLGV